MKESPLRALIFDSLYDKYKGVIAHVGVMEGSVRPGQNIFMMHTKKKFTVTELGYFRPGGLISADALYAGEVGFIGASIKNVADTRVGDTVTLASNPAGRSRCPDIKGQFLWYSAVFIPRMVSKYSDLRDALEKLQLNDASLLYEPENVSCFGFRFRCISGVLHME